MAGGIVTDEVGAGGAGAERAGRTGRTGGAGRRGAPGRLRVRARVSGAAVVALVCAVLFGGLYAMAALQPTLGETGVLASGKSFPYLLADAGDGDAAEESLAIEELSLVAGTPAESSSSAESAAESSSADLSSSADSSSSAAGTRRFVANLAEGSVDVMVFGFLQHGTEAVLLLDGKEVARAPLDEANAIIMTTTLSVPRLQGQVELSLVGGSTSDVRIFVDGGQTMHRVLRIGQAMGSFELGLLIAMAVWGAALYGFKRSESYMLHFVVYVAFLLLQVVLFAHVWDGAESLYYAASRCSVVATSMLSVDVCYRLAGVRAEGWLGRVLTARGIALTSLAGAIATYLLWAILGLAIDWVIYAACIVAAIWGCCKTKPSLFFVPATLLVSSLLRGCGTVFGFLGLSRGFLYSALLTTPPFFDVPFVLAAMAAVNRLFAGKFNEAERLNVELDALVAERTEGLREQEAQRRQLMLNVFHDLRSPLFVLGDLARTSARDPDRAQENAPAVLERVDMLTRLTNDLFYMAKLEEGRVLFAEDSFDLAGLLRQSVDAWRASAAEAGVALELAIASPVTVVGDELRLKEAVDNLVANAVRHSETGGSIEVSLRVERPTAGEDVQVAGEGAQTPEDAGVQVPAAPGLSAIVEVTDHGEGIAPEDLPDVFRQYYSRTSRGAERSTGIGLSIAQAIVTRMGGTLEAASVLGEGTTMTVRLPAAPVVVAD